MKRGLIIFAREPVPGTVKTRLAQAVGDDAAAELYAAMLADVLETATGLDDVRPLIFWALTTGGVPSLPAFPRLEAFMQLGPDLGERMANAFQSTFDTGIEACCIIGTDSPDLPGEYILQAFDLLERGVDAVFGPAEDGGYYLLGLRQVPQRLFEDIPWGTAEVLQRSLERAGALGLEIALLPPWHDIDTLDGLERLASSPHAARLGTCREFGKILTGKTPP